MTETDDRPKAGPPPLWAALGDSITYGTGTSNPATKAYPALVGIESEGRPGQALCDPLYMWPSFADSFEGELLALPTLPDFVVVEIGTNDINTLGATFYQMRVAYNDVLTAGHDHGVQVVLALLTPQDKSRPWYGDDNEALRKTVNAWMRTKDHIVDFATPLNDGTGNLRPEYDSGDGIHPNDAGQARLATALRGVIA